MSFQPIDTRWGARHTQQALQTQLIVLRGEQEFKKRLKKRARKERDPMKDRLKQLQEKAKRAQSRAVARERRLYSFGQPLFDYEKHQQLLKEIRAERNAILREVMTEAKEISAEGRRQVDLLQEFPRDSILNSGERSELTFRLPLIRSEFEHASPQRIARRLEAVHETGSKVERYASWFAANERRRELEEKGQEHAYMAFAKEFGALDRGLFAEEFQRRAAGPAETVNQAEEIATFCFTKQRDAERIATAREYSYDKIIEKQKYEFGGRVPVSSLDKEDRTPAGAGGVAND